jgi:ABC-type nickel/cobalt efflux system permease component RcnA
MTAPSSCRVGRPAAFRAARWAAAALGVLAGLCAGVLLSPAAPAAAHPLGNFTVNQLDAIELYPDHVSVTAVVDAAELPTLQDKPTVDRNGDGTADDAERAAYARTTCVTLAGGLDANANGHRLQWTDGGTATFEYTPGAAGLFTSRLTCPLRAAATLDAPSTMEVANRYRSDRIGWREMTAVGHGVALVPPTLPTTSISDDLRAYPQDLLSSPLDVRSARLVTRPGPAAPPATAPAGSSSGLPSSGVGSPAAGSPGSPMTRPGGDVAWSARADLVLQNLVGGRHLRPLVGLLAVLLAIALGAGHAALPGHGKTVMAVYLTGGAGRIRDAVGVAATVTLTHTGGVLVLGLLLTTVASLAGETVLGWLGVVSGLMVAAVGAGMLRAARRRRAHRNHRHDHDHPHHHARPHHHDHDHDHGHDRTSRWSIVGMGVAGGLVPSPSAVVVLLGAIGLGRTGFGILLVVGYGAGMAATLTAAGLALVALRRRWPGRLRLPGTRWAAVRALAPTGTATLVLLVGVGLAGRAVLGLA